MKYICLALLLALGACAPQPRTCSSPRVGILGGGNVMPGTSLARHVVAIRGLAGDKGFLCTGVLITSNRVLTAGHCGVGLQSGQIVFSTDLNTRDPRLARPITSVAVQPRFDQTVQRVDANPNRDPNKVKNWGDLAVIGFSGSVPAGYTPADIAGEDAVVDGESVLLAGYGEIDGEAGIPSSQLKAVSVKVKKARYSQSEFTVDQSDGKGACHGDSGGPAFVADGDDLYLVGITSRGFDDVCGNATVYTRVSSFLKWIKSEI